MAKKKTDAQFKKEVYDLVGTEYSFIESYVNAHTKIKVKHNKCGYVYSVDPASFLYGKRCPHCAGNLKKNNAQFKKEVCDLVGDEYTFLDPYVSSSIKIRVRHNECGYIYKVRPNDFLNGTRCPKCNKKMRKTDEEFKQEVYDLVGDEYTFIEPYKNALTPLKVKHNKCGSIYKVTPSDFINTHHRCAFCQGLLAKTNTQFKQEIKSLVGNEYDFIDSYINNHTKLKIKHNVCGKVYKVTPKDFLRGRRCPYCANKKHKDTEKFAEELSVMGDGEYLLLSKYINANTKVKIQHVKCGNVYEVKPYSFLQGNRCPYCNEPHTEQTVAKVLSSLGIRYEVQKTFDDLKDSRLLSYDFYIPSQNILIEYQGKQHYEPVEYFGGNTKFATQQKHDKMKSDYARNNNYNLITIPYTKNNFSKIKKYLLQHGLSK